MASNNEIPPRNESASPADAEQSAPEATAPEPANAETVPPEPAEAELLPETAPAPAEVVRPSWWSRLIPGARRREEQMARLQAGHQEVVGLVRSIRDNLEAQVDTQRHLLNSLASLPEAMDGLRRVGELTEQQREMLGVIRDQLDNHVEHNRHMAGSLERFSQTMASMDNTTRTLAGRADESEKSLRQLLERSERRLTLLTLLLMGLLVGGFVWMYNQQRPAAPEAPLRAPGAQSIPAAGTPETPPPPLAPLDPSRLPLVTPEPAPIAPVVENSPPVDAPTPAAPPVPVAAPDAPAPAPPEPQAPAEPPAPPAPPPAVEPPPEAKETDTEARLRELRELMDRAREERTPEPAKAEP